MKLRNKKTGKLYEWCSILVKKNRKSVKLLVAEKDDDDREIYYYESFEKMCEEWETVEDPQPKKPLIKDEKIRKAVRAWADANKFTIFIVNNKQSNTFEIRGLTDIGDAYGCSIYFKGIISKTNNITYTITELCGEEIE